jgi:hypothetical protein
MPKIKEKNKGGRPKKTINDLPKNWKRIVENEFKEGASQKEVMALLGIGSQLFYDLLKRDEEFSNTIKRFLELSEAWWLREGRKNLKNKKFSPVLWYMNMKNRFGWADKQEIQHSGELSLSGLFDKSQKDE